MSNNVMLSNLTQIYGSGSLISIRLTFKKGIVTHNIDYILPETSISISTLYANLISAVTLYAWTGTSPKPILAVDFISEIGTKLSISSPNSDVLFDSIRIISNIDNPTSLELKQILGFTLITDSDSASTTYSITPALTYITPYMGTFRLQTHIDNLSGFTSDIGSWTPVRYKSDNKTDVTKLSVSNGTFSIVRGMLFTILNLHGKYLSQYDLFVDFARRSNATITLSFNVDLIGDGTYTCRIIGDLCGDEELLFDFEHLFSYPIGIIPVSSMEA